MQVADLYLDSQVNIDKICRRLEISTYQDYILERLQRKDNN